MNETDERFRISALRLKVSEVALQFEETTKVNPAVHTFPAKDAFFRERSLVCFLMDWAAEYQASRIRIQEKARS